MITHRPRRSRRASSALEFALALPFFMTLVLGTLDLGYFFRQHEVVALAVMDGVRMGASTRTDSVGTTGDANTTAELADVAIVAKQVTERLLIEAKICTASADCGVTAATTAYTHGGYRLTVTAAPAYKRIVKGFTVAPGTLYNSQSAKVENYK